MPRRWFSVFIRPYSNPLLHSPLTLPIRLRIFLLCSDNHYRSLVRLITKHAWLYTEMIAAETIVYQQTNLDRFLACPSHQHPIVLQIGGSNVQNLAKASKLSDAYGYDEINLKLSPI